MQAVVYHSQDIQAWEQRWFAAQNSSLGLMQQAAWSITQQLIVLFQKQNFKNIAVW
ncbi:bifunctional ADP-dependent NAD(P)H-hydrate dehydratase/NAD(P)H-hydrate epimerase, partial [Acinetobacter baumannii]